MELLSWKVDIEKFISREENFDVTLLCLHGYGTDGVSHNVIDIIDTEIKDGGSKRITCDFDFSSAPKHRKQGIFINLGCNIAQGNFADGAIRHGYNRVICTKSGSAPFSTVAAWVINFIDEITADHFRNQSGETKIFLNDDNLRKIVNSTNRMLREEERYILYD